MSWHLSSHRALKKKQLRKRKRIYLRKKPQLQKLLRKKHQSQRNKKSSMLLDWKSRMMRFKPQLKRILMSSQRMIAQRLLMRYKSNQKRKTRRTKRVRNRIRKKHQLKRIQQRNLMVKMTNSLSKWREEKVTKTIVMKRVGSNQDQLRKQSKSLLKRLSHPPLKRHQVFSNRKERSCKQSTLVRWLACPTKMQRAPKKLLRHNL